MGQSVSDCSDRKNFENVKKYISSKDLFNNEEQEKGSDRNEDGKKEKKKDVTEDEEKYLSEIEDLHSSIIEDGYDLPASYELQEFQDSSIFDESIRKRRRSHSYEDFRSMSLPGKQSKGNFGNDYVTSHYDQFQKTESL